MSRGVVRDHSRRPAKRRLATRGERLAKPEMLAAICVLEPIRKRFCIDGIGVTVVSNRGATKLEVASLVNSGWRLVVCDLATLPRKSSPATRERREAQMDHRVTALSAAGNDASLGAVS